MNNCIRKFSVNNKCPVDVEVTLTFQWDRRNPPNCRLPVTGIEITVEAKRNMDVLFLYKKDPFKDWGYYEYTFKARELDFNRDNYYQDSDVTDGLYSS